MGEYDARKRAQDSVIIAQGKIYDDLRMNIIPGEPLSQSTKTEKPNPARANNSAENLKSDHPVHNGGYCNVDSNSFDHGDGKENILGQLQEELKDEDN